MAEGVSLGSTVLKVAHHGSCSSTTQEFLEAVDPEVVVISVGADNDFGHSYAGVLERLEARPERTRRGRRSTASARRPTSGPSGQWDGQSHLLACYPNKLLKFIRYNSTACLISS